MAAPSKCPFCGAELPGNAPAGLCPQCLLHKNFPEFAELTPGEDSPQPPLAEVPGRAIGPYKLICPLGEGGMGEVFLAGQEEPILREVALKIIKLGMNTRAVLAQFKKEREALERMDHPNIAKVLDAGATGDGRPYFVMEYIEGESITDYCDRLQVSVFERLGLFMQVCQAIQHAHQKGVIHCDIKPSNVLVCEIDGKPVPKVIDFGIAQATVNQALADMTLVTSFRLLAATPSYMSPEQADGSGDIDTRSDIYSLGVLLYELLAGQPAFDKEELRMAADEEVRRIVREKDPPKPSARLTTLTMEKLALAARNRRIEPAKLPNLIRGDLDWIVMRALEKDRARRYETANGLAQEIQRFLDHEPILARQPSRLYRLRKMIRRNRLAFAAVCAILVTLIFGISLSSWLFVREKAARQLADANARFLEDMLKGVGPSVSRGRDTILLREILDNTLARLGKPPKAQPEVEAELRETIGEVYRALGEFKKAESMHRQALALRRAVLGNTHADTARSLDNLAVILSCEGKLEEGETMEREALQMTRRALGSENPAVAASLNNLADMLRVDGKLAEAEATNRLALALRLKLFGQQNRDVASSMFSLANVLYDEGRLPEAEAMHRQVLAVRRKLLAHDDPDVAGSLNNLAGILLLEGKFADAETAQREALAIQRKILPANHEEIAGSLDNMGAMLWYQGKYSQAEDTYREALAMQRKLLDEPHPDIAMTLNDLGDVLLREGKLAEAEETHRAALAMRRKLHRSEHPDVAVSLNSLATVLKERGKLAEAETTVREALAMRMKLFTNDNSFAAESLSDLAGVLELEGKLPEAEKACRAALAMREKIGPGDWTTFGSRSQLGGLLAARTNYAEAAPLLLSGYEGMKHDEAAIPVPSRSELKEAIQRLVRLYEATAQSDKAAEWKKRLDTFP